MNRRNNKTQMYVIITILHLNIKNLEKLTFLQILSIKRQNNIEKKKRKENNQRKRLWWILFFPPLTK